MAEDKSTNCNHQGTASAQLATSRTVSDVETNDDSFLSEVLSAISLPPLIGNQDDDENEKKVVRHFIKATVQESKDLYKPSEDARCDRTINCTNEVAIGSACSNGTSTYDKQEHFFKAETYELGKQKNLEEEAIQKQRQQIQALLLREQQNRPSLDIRPIDESDSDADETTTGQEISIGDIARRQLENGKITIRCDQATLVVVDSEQVENFSKNMRIRRVLIGGKQDPQPDDKVILLFGSKKVGKTATVSSMLNFLYDVKKQYSFRFILDENIKPTDELVEYVINNSVLPYSITFVDTPGLVDIDGYIETSSIIREWFEERLLKDGKFCLDAITIVLRSDDEELSWPYIHELAAVKRMFGDDLKVNVLPVITFSEVLPQPLAVRAMANANITFLEYYKINNAGFFEVNRKINGIDSTTYFEHGMQSFKRYFTDLDELECPLLSLKTSPCSLHSSIEKQLQVENSTFDGY